MPPETNGADRLPPQSRDAERSVLGRMLRDNPVIGDVVQIVRADNFYLDAHQKIFQAIASIYDRGHPVDLVLLADLLKEQKYIEDVGGYGYLAELWDAAPTAANAEYYARIVRDKAQVRSLIHASTEILRDAYDQSEPADQMLEQAERKILDIAQMGVTGQTTTLQEALREAYDRIDDRHAARQPGGKRFADGIRRSRREDGGAAEFGADHRRRSAERGQNQLRAQHRTPYHRQRTVAGAVREPGAVAHRDRRALAVQPRAGGQPQAAHRPPGATGHGKADRSRRHPAPRQAVHRRHARAEHAAHRRQRPPLEAAREHPAGHRGLSAAHRARQSPRPAPGTGRPDFPAPQVPGPRARDPGGGAGPGESQLGGPARPSAAAGGSARVGFDRAGRRHGDDAASARIVRARPTRGHGRADHRQAAQRADRRDSAHVPQAVHALRELRRRSAVRGLQSRRYVFALSAAPCPLQSIARGVFPGGRGDQACA